MPGAGAASGYANHSLCMYYDDFGNRTQSAWQTAACPAPPAPGKAAPSPTAIYNAANQVTNNSYTYDKSGNVTYDGANWYAYDNEGRLCAMQTNIAGPMVATGYLYDAEGRRVAKGTIPVTATPITSSACVYPGKGFVTTETYVLGQGGEQLSTWAWSGSTGTWERTNVYGAGAHLATFDADPAGSTTAALHFMLTDHLGTRRMQTDPAGTPETDCQSLPYGDGLNCFIPANAPATADDSNPLHFTGKERDTESGNDYFGARYYSSAAGRFMIPDWALGAKAVPYASFMNPQSLNLYEYVGNGPLGGIDPDGHDWSQVWADVKAAVGGVSLQVSLGVGVGGKASVGPVDGKAEASLKGTMSFSDGKLSASKSAEIGVTLGAGGKEVGASASIDQTMGSKDFKTGETGGTEPATTDTVLGIKQGSTSSGVSSDGISASFEGGDGLLFGAGGGISSEGLKALGDVLNDIKNTVLKTPDPPPMPPQTRQGDPTQ